MAPNTAHETDALAQLEERIQRAVALVTRLRQEKEDALKELTETQAAWEESQTEITALKAERQQVRTRLEKLLTHIDTLGAA
jgi:predicted  nucleic acid-binding Zn-ribbon protein